MGSRPRQTLLRPLGRSSRWSDRSHRLAARAVPLLILAGLVQVAGLAAPANAAGPAHQGTLTGHVAFAAAGGSGIPCAPMDFGCIPGGPPGGLSAGAATPGVTVEVYAQDNPGTVLGTTTTDQSGAFAVVVPTTTTFDGSYFYGEFYLRVSGDTIDPGWYSGDLDHVVTTTAAAGTASVGDGASTDAGTALVDPAGTAGGVEPDQPLEATGTVTTVAGVAVAAATVTVFHQSADAWEVEATGTTDATGHYDIALPDGVRGDLYTVRAAKDDVSRYAGNGTSVDTAYGVFLSGPFGFQPITLPVNSLSGTLTAPTGTKVEALVWDQATSAWKSADPALTTTTAADGTWAFTGIPAGTYSVRYTDNVYETGLLAAPANPSGNAHPMTATSEVRVSSRTLPVIGAITGTTSPAGATVELYRWNGTNWIPTGTVTSDADTGAYTLPAVAGTYTLKYSRDDLPTTFLGGGTGLPVNGQTGPRTVTVSTADPVHVPPVTLAGTPGPDFGNVAGQAAEGCFAHQVTGGGDQVTLPFAVKVDGTSYTTAYVSTNGNVSLGGPESFDPSGPTHPVLAPMAVTGHAELSRGTVTWGVTGRSLCVVWSRVAGVNTYQLLLTSATGEPGRQPGDADVTFNYDRLHVAVNSGTKVGVWLPVQGVGAWTLVPHTDGDPSDWLDGGRYSLLSGSRGPTTTPGRYIFGINNPAPPTTGSIRVRVSSPQGTGVSLIACRTGTNDCTTGHVSFFDIDALEFQGGAVVALGTLSGLKPGEYTVTWVGDGADYQIWADGAVIPTVATVTVVAGQQATATVGTRPAVPVPVGVAVAADHGTTMAGETKVAHGEVVTQTASCSGATATYRVYSNATGAVVTGKMTEVAPKKYTAEVPSTMHGSTQFTFTITCPGAAAVATTFDLYIDPSGTVVDQYGLPVAGATVVLKRSDTFSGVFETVPDGSAIMSDSNQANPWTTPADGGFHWDVVAGYYTVTASKAGCEAASTDVMQVPVERTAIVLKLTCTAGGGTAPTPTLAGSAAIGGTLTATAAAPAGYTATYQWRRNGSAISGATGRTYKVARADAGTKVAVDVSYQRAAAPVEAGSSTLVSFTLLTRRTTALSVAPLKAARLRVTSVGGAKSAKVTVTLTLTGVAASKVSGTVLVAVSGARSVTAKIVHGKVVVPVRGLAKGKHTVTVTYAGTNAYSSATATAKVTVR